MGEASISSSRDRLYEAYATNHAGYGNGEAGALIYRRDIRPALPLPGFGPVLDIGCGQGHLVSLMLADGYNAEGVDVSAEQVRIAWSSGLDRVRLGDYRELMNARPGQLGAITATDVLEHLPKPDVLDTFDRAMNALTPGGVFIARVPNAASPLGGRIRYGDFTHESSHTATSVRQVAAAAGFSSVTVKACPPVVHGLASATRLMIWKSVSAYWKMALVAETGMVRGHIVTQNLTFAARKAG